MPEPDTSRFAIACPSCHKALAVPRRAVGRRVKCPACDEVFIISEPSAPSAVQAPVTAAAPGAASPSASGTLPAGKAPAAAVCAICQAPIEAGDTATPCPSCRSVYHTDCWEYNRGCGQYGCDQSPPTEKLDDLEMPASYWGHEDKACPRCGRVIKAAALRCRHCGATFESARPQEAHQFQQRLQVKSRVPRVRAQGVWLLVFSLLTCTAPLAALIGVFWYSANRQTIAALPPLNAALCKIAVGVAWLQLFILAMVSIVYSLMTGM